MSSTSSFQAGNVEHRVQCDCGVLARIRTSYTGQNPGRRFYGCTNWKREGGGGCDFFAWADPQIPPRAKIIISQLREQKGELEAQVKKLKLEGKRLKLALTTSLCFIVAMWLIKLCGE